MEKQFQIIWKMSPRKKSSRKMYWLAEKECIAIFFRLFCIEDAAAPRIFPVPLKASSLHPKHVLILGKRNHKITGKPDILSDFGEKLSVKMIFRCGKEYLLLAWGPFQVRFQVKGTVSCWQNIKIWTKRRSRSPYDLSRLWRFRILALFGWNAR